MFSRSHPHSIKANTFYEFLKLEDELFSTQINKPVTLITQGLKGQA